METQNLPRKQPHQQRSQMPLFEKNLLTASRVGTVNIERQNGAQASNTPVRKVLLPSRRNQNSVTSSGGQSHNVIILSDDDESQKRSVKRRHQSEVTPGFDSESSSKRFRENSNGPPIARALRYHSTNSYDKFLPERPLFTLETLTQELMEHCRNSVQTFELLEKKMRLRFALERLVKNHFPGSTLHLVGSSCNGFGSNKSDADFCLLLTQMRKIDQRFEARHILLGIHRALQQCEFVKDSKVIFATVPIIKFKDKVSQCECDININNIVGIRNTHLLRVYCGMWEMLRTREKLVNSKRKNNNDVHQIDQSLSVVIVKDPSRTMDQRVQPLVMVVKKWAKSRNINDASSGTLSSYALVLMVIHYLQDGCSPVVLPSVQVKHPAVFGDNMDVAMLLHQDPFKHIQCHRSENTQSVGELLLGFFKYFVEDFKWSEYFISVRQGKKFPRGSHFKWRNKFICIEEPFDYNSVARAVYNEENFEKILTQFKVAWNTLKVSPSLKSIL